MQVQLENLQLFHNELILIFVFNHRLFEIYRNSLDTSSIVSWSSSQSSLFCRMLSTSILTAPTALLLAFNYGAKKLQKFGSECHNYLITARTEFIFCVILDSKTADSSSGIYSE